MQASANNQLRSRIATIAAAAGFALVIGALGIGPAHADGYNNDGDNGYRYNGPPDQQYYNGNPDYRGPAVAYAPQPDYYYEPQPDYYAAPEPDRYYYRPGPSVQVQAPGISLFFGR
jgi:hypothetical protein